MLRLSVVLPVSNQQVKVSNSDKVVREKESKFAAEEKASARRADLQSLLHSLSEKDREVRHTLWRTPVVA